MLSLKKAVMPSAVEVDGIFYAIKTDYQYFLLFLELLNKHRPMLEDFDFMYVDRIPEDRQKGIDALTAFAFPKRELPRISAQQNSEIPFDYDIDADLIYAAFMQQYKIDLIDENLHLHWYKFRALFESLENTRFTDIMGYRLFVPKGKLSEMDKEKLKLKEMWKIEPELTEEEQALDDEFERLHGLKAEG